MSKNPLAVKLGKLAKGVKKTMTIEAIEQRRNANRSRWAKWRTRNRRKRKPISARNLALIIGAVALIGSAVLIWRGEQPRQELWATFRTIDAAPSVEIIP